jgi:TnpA family transposase
VPTQFLSTAERRRLMDWPATVAEADLATYYTLDAADLEHIGERRGAGNRLGVALQLGALRHLGFVPDNLQHAPPAVLASLAPQLQVPVTAIADYADRAQTRTDHLTAVARHLGYRLPGEADLAALADWLVERALEHEQPTLLLHLTTQHLRAQRLVRPGITVLERLVAAARERAEAEIFHRVDPLLVPARRAALDALLVTDAGIRGTRLAWLRVGATAPTPTAILAEIAKLTYLRGLEADRWELAGLNPNRRKRLAQRARCSTNQALQRMLATRRYPALLAFCADSVAELTDEIVDLFDRALAGTDARARRARDELRRSTARATNEQVRLFIEVGRILLDPAADAQAKLSEIETRIGLERLRAAVEEATRLARPEDDSYFDFLASRYSYLREFTPTLLTALELRASTSGAPLLAAIVVLRQLNQAHRRRVPEDTSTTFVPARWRPYVTETTGKLHRRYWELCVLSELRAALRAGDIWVVGSRRYANPETYLIPTDRWPALRPDVVTLVSIPVAAEQRLDTYQQELTASLRRVEAGLAHERGIRVVHGELVVSRLVAEDVTDDTVQLRQLIADRLPRVELAELLIEVDHWTGFSRHCTHAGGSTTRTPDLAVHLYAAILAQACNLGVTTMAEIADLTYRQLAWTTEWYLREETLRTAIAAIVNYQHRLPLAEHWGGGTLSSSDGQRFPVAVKSPVATALPRYFGLGRGVTAYTHVSDQHATYATTVIPATVRDATYVLDGILHNETELPIVEHTTDTAGYTDLVFALFDLLGLQFSPRIRDLGDQRLYRLGPAERGEASALLKGSINRQLIMQRWDDLLRVAGSLKLGWVSASLLIARLQASPRQNALTRALQEYGRLVKTRFILRYLESADYRRRINRQLNKGESLHALRRFLFFAERGTLRRHQQEDQANQASCLTLVTNAVVTWNTVYIGAVVEELRTKGHVITDETLGHLSPALYDHINPYGTYQFDLEAAARLQGLRPLRRPAEPPA